MAENKQKKRKRRGDTIPKMDKEGERQKQGTEPKTSH